MERLSGTLSEMESQRIGNRVRCIYVGVDTEIESEKYRDNEKKKIVC